jgi:hypothetical protein
VRGFSSVGNYLQWMTEGATKGVVGAPGFVKEKYKDITGTK